MKFHAEELIRKAKMALPVIVATQMMETMITSLTPTRAELTT
jgi:pyruvate kinase